MDGLDLRERTRLRRRPRQMRSIPATLHGARPNRDRSSSTRVQSPSSPDQVASDQPDRMPERLRSPCRLPQRPKVSGRVVGRGRPSREVQPLQIVYTWEFHRERERSRLGHRVSLPRVPAYALRLRELGMHPTAPERLKPGDQVRIARPHELSGRSARVLRVEAISRRSRHSTQRLR